MNYIIGFLYAVFNIFYKSICICSVAIRAYKLKQNSKYSYRNWFEIIITYFQNVIFVQQFGFDAQDRYR